MTLIMILLSLALERFVGTLDELRQLKWFRRYYAWMETHLVRIKLWDGATGVLVVIAPPLFAVALIFAWVENVLGFLYYVFATVVLLYSLGPKDLKTQIEAYIEALKTGDKTRARSVAKELMASDAPGNKHVRAHSLVERILVQANNRLFAVVFWFAILGPIGALLYRLASELVLQPSSQCKGFAGSADDLYDILNWAPARLLALGYAIAGSLVDALEAWRENEEASLRVNESVIKASGMHALQFSLHQDDVNIDQSTENEEYWITATQGLVDRTLIVWLTVLAIMTLVGWTA
ncbi:MAG: regulatory signaling modulator protein AmpE [Gammaproteobacteria bacterium]|nr:regulatory signaling modulator protein AmpE [Gammaproteobacteria bacterium]MCI0591731.1 regulatory signaling modulator protein AmpE [Gammaproteobacteria bacterium]